MKVVGGACGVTQEGTAFVVKPGVIVTNAHVIAGEAETEVDADGMMFPAVPVLFDPQLDLAILRTSAPLGRPLVLAAGYAARGTQGAIVGYPENGPLTVTPAGVATRISAVTRDIYNQGVVTKEVYQIDAVVQPGNSGSPLLAGNGEVVGVVFSRSTTNPDVGYALTSSTCFRRSSKARSAPPGSPRTGCSPE